MSEQTVNTEHVRLVRRMNEIKVQRDASSASMKEALNENDIATAKVHCDAMHGLQKRIDRITKRLLDS